MKKMNWRSFKSRLAMLLSFTLVLSTIVLPAQKAVAAQVDLSQILFSLTTNGKDSTGDGIVDVESGEVFTYVLNYSFSGINTGAEFSGLSIEFPLPEGVEYVDSFVPTGGTVQLASGYPQGDVRNGGQTLRFVFTDDKPPKQGDAYQIQVNARYLSYETPDLTTKETSYSFQTKVGDTVVEMKSEAVKVTSHASPDFRLTKNLISPVTTPKPGSNAQYEIDFRNYKGGSIGNLHLENVTIRDILPPEAVFVSASNGGFESEPGVVTWPKVDSLMATDSLSYKVTVNYPATVVDSTYNVENRAIVTYNPVGESEITDTATFNHGFTDDYQDAGSGAWKSVDHHHQQFSPGQTVDFYIGGIRNKTNDDIMPPDTVTGSVYAYVLTDMHPSLNGSGTPYTALKLIQVGTATFEDVPGDQYYMEYTTDNGISWQPWGEPVSTLTPQTLDVSGLNANGIRFNFPGPLPISFEQKSNFRMTYQLDEGAIFQNGDKIRNVAQWSYWFDGKEVQGNAGAEAYLYTARPLIELKKEVVGKSTGLIPGDEVEFKLTATNTSRSSQTLYDPIIIDVLPKELTYIQDSWRVNEGSTGLNGSNLTQTNPDYVASNLNNETHEYSQSLQVTNDFRVMRSEFKGTVEAGQSFTVTFKAKVNDYISGTIRNRAELMTNSAHNPYINDYNFPIGINPGVDVYDHDNDGKKDDLYVYSFADITVNEVPLVESIKEVRGELDDWSTPDGGWSEMGKTTPGGRVEYRLTVHNPGNVTLKDVVIVDVLPKVGDKSVNPPYSARDSRWSTILTDKVTVPAGITVEYSTLDNVTMSTTSGWSTTPPADLTKVTALRFNFGALQIAPGESLSMTWPMRAPYDAPQGVDEIAWNSFAHESTPIGHSKFHAAEPPKVGVYIEENTKGEIGNYVWADVNRNGIQDDVIPWNGPGPHPFGPNGIPGINGVLVELLDNATGDVLQKTLTGNDTEGNPGYYLFTNLDDGDYKVRFHLPADNANPIGVANWGFEGWTVKGAGSNVEEDSNVGGAIAGANSSPQVDSEKITIGPVKKRHDIDAGLVIRPGEIGDKVWHDSNWDGIQDSVESGLAGVTVSLEQWDGTGWSSAKHMDDTPVAPQITTAAGTYLFNNLLPGQYRVVFDSTAIAEDYIFTLKEQKSDREKDSNVGTSARTNMDPAYNPVQTTSSFWLPLGGLDHSIDAGFVSLAQAVSLGDQVWIDIDNNGIQDDGVVPNYTAHKNLTVKLFKDGQEFASTKTDSDGKYLFEHLKPGNYEVRFSKPSGFMFSKQSKGTDRELDSDVNQNGSTGSVVLAANQHRRDIDAGLVPLASIGNQVWMDYDEDGFYNPNASKPKEKGIAGITVNLYKAADDGSATNPNVNGTPHKSMQTNSSGQYLFSDLEPNVNYVVQFVLPDGYKFTNYTTAADHTVDNDSDADPTNDGRTRLIRPIPGEKIQTVDAGLIELSSIGDFVWIDMNENGVQDENWIDWNGDGKKDAGEEFPGLNGVTVHLLDGNDPSKVLATTTTKNKNGQPGYYLFPNLDSGNYIVEFVQPTSGQYHGFDIDAVFPGWTLQGAGTSNEKDSNASPTTGRSDIIKLNVGEHNMSIDAGLLPPLGKLGDRVWLDDNGDGIQDTGESGVKDVTVRLLKATDNTLLDTTTTDANGDYVFDELKPGQYKVEFEIPTGGTHPKRLFTVKGAGTDVEKDSNVNVPALPATLTTGRTDSISLALGEYNMTIDAGLIGASSLGDLVWIDMDGDGTQNFGAANPNEVPYAAGVTVTLYDENGNVLATKKTDANGAYLFDYLYAGTYQIGFELPSGYIFSKKWVYSGTNLTNDHNDDSDADASGKTGLINLGINEQNLDVDAGLIPLASIGNYVWMDKNLNGLQDEGPEYAIEKVQVNLLDSAGNPVLDSGNNPVTTETDANGLYRFDHLVPNIGYIVEFVLPPGYEFAKRYAGSDNGKDSDADPAPGANFGRSGIITPKPNEFVETVDAGLVVLASIGDYVWIDMDGNGLQDDWIDWNGNGKMDPGEEDPGVNGVKVELLDADNGDAVVGSTVTATNTVTGKKGFYIFEDISPKNYKLRFVMPDQPLLTALGLDAPFKSWTKQYAVADPLDPAGSEAQDSNASNDPAQFGKTEVIALGANERIMTIDAGLLPPLGEIGDRVWLDANDNGIQDPGEAGVTGVTVRLLDGNGDFIQSTTTDSNGNYYFKQLKPGSYMVEFEIPSGADDPKRLFTFKGDGSDAENDSNVNVPTTGLLTIGRTDVIVLGLGKVNHTIDAGLIEAASIGDYVWVDSNNDGLQDSADEAGYAGLLVTLYDKDGNKITTTTTDANGKYLFDYLRPGQYQVGFDLPAGFMFSKKWAKGGLLTNDHADDSDVNASGRTDIIELALGENNLDVDAGLVPLASIGDYVWMDKNLNGLQDEGPEYAIEKVQVNLLDSAGNPVLDSSNNPVTTETDANGLYRFDHLVPSIGYIVEFVLPPGYEFAKRYAGSDNAKDSDADPVPGANFGRSGVITPKPDEFVKTVDAGLVVLASIGDYVWIDMNGNGLQDDSIDWNGDGVMDNDPGVNGVKVELLDADNGDAVVGSTVTATNTVTGKKGYYIFEDISPKNYKLRFVMPDQPLTGLDIPFKSWTKQYAVADLSAPEGSLAQDSNASNDPAQFGKTGIIALGADERNMTIDAGLLPPLGEIGDRVWLDTNFNGIQDPGEAGVGGVTVNLLDGNRNFIQSTTTDSNGNYYFKQLKPGSYMVEFVIPSGNGDPKRLFTIKGDGTNVENDSNVNVPTNGQLTVGLTDVIVLGLGKLNHTIDAGLIEAASIGDYVWVDSNNDGLQNSTGESGYAGLTVTLYDDSNNKIATTTTDANGKYLFDYLLPGQYQVGFDLPAGFMFSKKWVKGGSLTKAHADDSDVNASGRTDIIGLALGENNLDVDAGLVPLASIGDYVWMDKNLDGIQDASEAGVENVQVRLYKGAVLLKTAATDADGYYLFKDLEPSVAYIVEFVLPSGYVFTKQLNADPRTSNTDSDANPNAGSGVLGRTAAVTPIPGEHIDRVDAGLIKLVTLGDRVWHDVDGNGIQDSGEPGIEGVKVKLYDAEDLAVSIEETTTDANGNYLFTDLYPGDYVVQFEQPGGSFADYLFTYRYVGDDETVDSNASTEGWSDVVSLVAGEDNLTIDAGLTAPAALGDFVWNDQNGNGIQDPAEKGLNKVKVELFDESGQKIGEMLTTDHPTNGPGYYYFDKLLPGKYKVKVTPLSGYMITTKASGSDRAKDSDIDLQGWTELVTLAPGENNLDIDAGIRQIPYVGGLYFAKLGDYVWHDLNKNGIQDANEPGINGVTVELYNENDALVSTTVTADHNGKAGYYLFENLPAPHTYSVRFILPAGYKFTTQEAGDSKEKDSDANADGWTAPVQLWANSEVMTVDAGLVKMEPGSIGDYVWHDKNENGLQDADEKGVNGVTVELYDSEGKLVATTTTAQDSKGKAGYYLFDKLVPGAYTVKFVLPGGYKFTTKNAGNDGELDSNADESGKTAVIVLAEGENNRSIDAGLLLDPDSTEKPEIPVDEEGDGGTGPGSPGGGTDTPDEETSTPDDGVKTPGQEEGEDGTNVPGAPGSSTTDEDGGKPSKPAPGSALPKTGEEAPITPWIGLLLISIAILLKIRQYKQRRLVRMKD